MTTEPEDTDEQSDVLFLQVEKRLREMLSKDIEKQKLEAQEKSQSSGTVEKLADT